MSSTASTLYVSDTYTGDVKGGVIVLDEGMSHLPESTRVRGEPAESRREIEASHESLLSLAGKAKGLPGNLTEQRDHYVHGQPKR
jgi:hypothetical protein